MKISAINSFYFNRNYIKNNRASIPIQKTDSFEKTSFKGQLPKDIQEKIPQGYTIDDLIKLSQEQSFFLMGVGANSEVFKLPFLDDYVLKVLNKDDPNGVKIGEFPDSINLGQPVWQSDISPRLIVLKKVEGKEHSIPAWSRTIWDENIKAPLLVTKEQADIYFDSVEKLALMPQDAFDNIVYKAKLLSDKNYKIDSINPNNLIVDDSEIHIIDYFKVKPKEKDVYQNCSYDLVAIMLDFTLLPEYFEKMDVEQKVKFLKYAKSINQKVQQGALKFGLSTDANVYRAYINETSKYFVTTSAFEEDGRENIRLYDYRMDDFLNWLNEL